ncbi:competence type IV pilus major pilin ComGC [Alteribacter aurantiacus]|uniref:competence type IV pilus major pilin ComGC n=1 Tax=Alteribacter aurantiacus TaxID=254410 RepID=UPI0003FF1997|nr:competence type IV pilus major pilin ComGC [Alteribacter aurantiacus]
MKRNEQGFTLIEMVIVLMIISVLLLIAVPGLGKNTEIANDKGCDATIKMVEAQIIAYNANEETRLTNLDELAEKGYVTTIKCPNNRELTVDDKGKVSAKQ